jgi:hypothetical protein
MNLDKMLKYNLGYKKLGHIRTSLDYLDKFKRMFFLMIKQLRPPTFLVTFTTHVNNWSILVKALKDLHMQHVQNFNIEN